MSDGQCFLSFHPTMERQFHMHIANLSQVSVFHFSSLQYLSYDFTFFDFHSSDISFIQLTMALRHRVSKMLVKLFCDFPTQDGWRFSHRLSNRFVMNFRQNTFVREIKQTSNIQVFHTNQTRTNTYCEYRFCSK